MPISIFQFSNTKPQDGTINLLYSQSIANSGNFTVIGACIPFESANNIERTVYNNLILVYLRQTIGSWYFSCKSV